MGTNKITIDEAEYREYIRLKVTNDELERITQKRIDEAVANAVDAKDKEWQELYDNTLADIESKGAVRVKCYSTSFLDRNTIEMHMSSTNGDLSELIDKYGLGKLIEFRQTRMYNEDVHYFEYNGSKFYACNGLKTLERDIEMAVNKLNKIKDKMIAIRSIDPEIFDNISHPTTTEKLDVKQTVKEHSKSWWRMILNN